MGAYNKYPSSVVPGHTEKVSPPLSFHSEGAGDKEVMNEIDQQLEAAMDNEGGNNPSGMNPYPTPPNPCPLPYPDEEGEVKPYNGKFVFTPSSSTNTIKFRIQLSINYVHKKDID